MSPFPQNPQGRFDDYEHLMSLIAYYGAATLGNLKPSSLISFKKEMNGFQVLATWDTFKHQLSQQFPVAFYELNRTENCVQVLFYHKNWLSNLIKSNANQSFLAKFGYTSSMSFEQSLNYLEGRYKVACPHEIGLFLGYPLTDVQLYCESPCSPCLAVGYWKVYADLELALAKFKAFDTARETCATLIKNGISPSEIIYFNRFATA